MNRLLFLIPVVVLLLMGACKDDKKKNGSTFQKTTVEPKKQVPPFNADSAYHFVEKQVSFGPRVPNTPAAQACAQYLTDLLRRFCDTVYVQEFKTYAFDKTVLNGKNIIGSFDPEKKKRIFLAAHWDSRPFADNDPEPKNHKTPILGANDGASGVGVLLEIARQISLSPPNVGVDIILFDAEDYGVPQDAQNQENNTWGLGSQYWSKEPHLAGYQPAYGILLDMVGDADAQFPMEYFSNYFAKHIVRKVWNTAEKIGHGTYFPKIEGAPITDDHYYINIYAGIPTIDIIHLRPESTNGSFVDYWHTLNDDMSNISPSTLKVVGEVVLHTVYEE